MSDTVNLILTGKILDGHSHPTVIHHLAKQLKITEEKAAALLQSAPRILKKNVDIATAQKYILLFQKLGVELKAKKQTVASAISTIQPTTQLKAESPVIRTAPRQQIPPSEIRETPSMSNAMQGLPPEARFSNEDEEEEDNEIASDPAPPFFSYHFEGRLGRAHMMIYSSALLVIQLILDQLGISFGQTLIFILSIRFTALRLHDMGISGWVMLTFLPIKLWGLWQLWQGDTFSANFMLGAAAFLIIEFGLYIIPGNKEDNSYGYPIDISDYWIKPAAIAAGLFIASIQCYNLYQAVEIINLTKNEYQKILKEAEIIKKIENQCNHEEEEIKYYICIEEGRKSAGLDYEDYSDWQGEFEEGEEDSDEEY